jgi:gliding motility-associated lipoprotein GldH
LKTKHLKYYIFLLPLLFVFISCDNERFYEKNHSISNSNWNVKEELKFEVDIEDTSSLYDFYINLRNTGGYAYSNIFLFVNTEFPDGNLSRDTIECFLADVHGKWLGSGSGDIWDNRILFKRNVIFPQKGTYKFSYEHAMRTENLAEIMDAGLRIEKKKQQ